MFVPQCFYWEYLQILCKNALSVIYQQIRNLGIVDFKLPLPFAYISVYVNEACIYPLMQIFFAWLILS